MDARCRSACVSPEEKTQVVHIDEGFDILGFRIQRHRKRGTNRSQVYTYPSKKALASIKAKVRTMTRGSTNKPLSVLCYRLAPVLRGWANYFRHGVSKRMSRVPWNLGGGPVVRRRFPLRYTRWM